MPLARARQAHFPRWIRTSCKMPVPPHADSRTSRKILLRFPYSLLVRLTESRLRLTADTHPLCKVIPNAQPFQLWIPPGPLRPQSIRLSPSFQYRTNPRLESASCACLAVPAASAGSAHRESVVFSTQPFKSRKSPFTSENRPFNAFYFADIFICCYTPPCSRGVPPFLQLQASVSALCVSAPLPAPIWSGWPTL